MGNLQGTSSTMTKKISSTTTTTASDNSSKIHLNFDNNFITTGEKNGDSCPNESDRIDDDGDDDISDKIEINRAYSSTLTMETMVTETENETSNDQQPISRLRLPNQSIDHQNHQDQDDLNHLETNDTIDAHLNPLQHQSSSTTSMSSLSTISTSKTLEKSTESKIGTPSSTTIMMIDSDDKTLTLGMLQAAQCFGSNWIVNEFRFIKILN